MAAYSNDNGTLRTIIGAYANDNGTLRTIYAAATNDNGTLRIAYFDQISISNETISNTNTDPTDSFAGYELQSDGDIFRNTGIGGGAINTDIGDWITPKINMAAYQCRATLNSGTTPVGTLNTWLALTSNRSWSLTRSTVGSVTCNLTVEIRRASDGVVLDSCTVILTAEVES